MTRAGTVTRFGAALWDLTHTPGLVPVLAADMLPGAQVIAVGRPDTADVVGIALRRAGFEIRDTLVWLRPGDHLLVTLARAPLAGTIVQNVLAHGVGGLNIEACRVPIGDADKAASEAKNAHTKFGTGPRDNHIYGKDGRDAVDWSGESGRFPTNLLLQHDATCTPVGTAVARGDSRAGTHVPGTRPGGFVNVGAGKGENRMNAMPYGDAEVIVFDCAISCPVRELDVRSGERRAGVFPPARGESVSSNLGHTGATIGGYRLVGDVGGASRYFPRFIADEHVWAWLERLIVPANVPVMRSGLAAMQ